MAFGNQLGPVDDTTGRELVAQNPLCVECERGLPLGAATEVDHIVPLQDGGAMYDEANLQGLCKSHHSQKTAKVNANSHPL